jgi:glycosyltransferase involved in cell wall biosynthesis
VKIVFVSEHASPLAALGGVDAGGQNVHVAELAKALVSAGHVVTVVTRRDDPDLPTQLWTADGYRVVHLEAGPVRVLPKDELWPHMPEFADRLVAVLEDDRPDLVHAHFWMSAWAAQRAADAVGLPTVVTFHALGSVKRRHQGAADTSPAERLAVEADLSSSVQRIIATCTDEVAELRAMGLPADRATVIPCGVDTDAFRPLPVPHGDRPRLAVVGRIVERKGVGNVIEALAQLPGVELVVGGGPDAEFLDTDPDIERLRRLADRHAVAERVRFLGSVGRGEVPRVMSSADVVVCVPWYEPFGIVPVEAMACGRPVVGSAVGGLLDTVVPGVTGELVPPRRPDVLAGVLRDLLADPQRRAAYGRAGRARAVTTSQWRQVVAETESAYASVTSTLARTGVTR